MVNKIGIVGAGTMGSGIASCSALKGFDTYVYEINPVIMNKAEANILKGYDKLLEKNKIDKEKYDSAKSNLHFFSDVNSLAECGLIIEAAFEDLNLKKDIYQGIEKICKADTILATNTSSFSITAISSFVNINKDRVIGMHFFNPANIMKLVEVITGEFTSAEVKNTVIEIAKKLGKTPVECRDTPAFIVNRVARSFYGEALKILGEGGIDVSDIDKIMKEVGSFAMGPFELMDLIGIDVNFSVTKSVYEAFFNDQKYKPHPIQQKMVEAGLLGRKTRRGFYNYKT